MKSAMPVEDTQVLMTCSHRPAAAPRGEAFDVVEFAVPGRAEMISYIRDRAAEAARAMSFTPQQVEDIRLAVGEAGSNAVRHGIDPDHCQIDVRIERRGDSLKISVSDRGCGFDPDSTRAAEPGDLADGGRGISIMRALMDEVTFHFDSPGTRVEMVKRIRAADDL